MPARRRYVGAMRVRRVFRWAIGVAAVGGLLAAGVVYALLCRIPSDYRPVHLSPEQQEAGMRRFVNHISRFGEKAGAGEPFTWSITAAQANEYLASVDAIASLPRERRVHPLARLERGGVVSPAVAMTDGALTFLFQSSRHKKIISVDVGFDFNDSGEVTCRLGQVRVGVMAVPKRIMDERLARVRRQLRRQLAEADRAGSARLGPIRMRHLADLLRRVVEMMDGAYVRPEILWPLGRHRVRVRRVEITPGRLTLHLVPADRPPRPAATAPRPAGGG